MSNSKLGKKGSGTGYKKDILKEKKTDTYSEMVSKLGSKGSGSSIDYRKAAKDYLGNSGDLDSSVEELYKHISEDRKIYKNISKKKGIKKVKDLKNEWVLSNDLKYKDPITGKTHKIGGILFDSFNIYSENNGKISFVDEKGNLYVAPFTKSRRKKLEDAGYKKGNLFVPFSSGEIPLDKEVRKKLLKMSSRASQINSKDFEKKKLEKYSKIAKEKGISGKKISGIWLSADGPTDGIKFKTLKNKSLVAGDDWNNIDRSHLIGYYFKNRGIIVFMDEKGKSWMGPDSPKSIESLEKVGYKRLYVVRFINRDRPGSGGW